MSTIESMEQVADLDLLAEPGRCIGCGDEMFPGVPFAGDGIEAELLCWLCRD